MVGMTSLSVDYCQIVLVQVAFQRLFGDPRDQLCSILSLRNMFVRTQDEML
jgi:hypothetical protein